MSSTAPRHRVRIVEDYGFTRAECTCGWVGTGRRSRASARAEGARHAAEHAGSGG